jgi:carboxypeptidase C (cathepsin A)
MNWRTILPILIVSIGYTVPVSVGATPLTERRVVQTERRQPLSPDERSESSHVIAIRGKLLKYHATAGRITLTDDSEKPEARMFYVAYTKDGAAERDRPVTFLFNGGPGSSSVYLHMGSFAPVRILPPTPASSDGVKPGVVPNPMTLLDATDLVFIDMVGTGYSRLEPGVSGSKFWSVDGDAQSFAQFVRKWIKGNGRNLSPKFLLGESYGTMRAAALAYELQSTGVSLNGVMLTGAALNYGVFTAGYDKNFVNFFPSFAAVAWYHHKAATSSADFQTFITEARTFASGPYEQALEKGHDVSPEEARAVATRYAEFAGLPVDYILGAKLRVDRDSFRKELLRSESRVLGRFDARFTGADATSIGATPESDPGNATVEPNLAASLQDYLRNDLKYEPDLTYRLGIQSMPGFGFDFKHQPPVGEAQITPDAAIDLAAAMRGNPNLHVVFLSGYYDLATPFGAAEYDSSHMLLDPDRRRNLSIRYYPSGHMLYFDDKVLMELHDNLTKFIKDAT